MVNHSEIINENLDKFVMRASLAGYPVIKPRVELKKLGDVGGLCCFTDPIPIKLNIDYLNIAPDKLLHQTLGHEFCHWIQHQYNLFTYTATGRRRTHDSIFYQLCRTIGIEPRRCHSMGGNPNKKRRRTPAKCPCGAVNEISTKRANIIRNSVYSREFYCVKCKGDVILV